MAVAITAPRPLRKLILRSRGSEDMEKTARLRSADNGARIRWSRWIEDWALFVLMANICAALAHAASALGGSTL
jgi:hypothetical protein